MPVENLRLSHLILILGASLTFLPASAGEILLTENFDTFKLDELPAGWTKSEPAMLTFLDEEGRGKVLKIVNKDEHYPSLVFTFDPAKAAGKTVRASVSAKFPAAYVPIADKLWASPKFMVEFKDKDGTVLGTGEVVPQAGKAEWQELNKEFPIPHAATQITASVCVQFVTAEVYFDNLSIEVTGDVPPPTPPPAAVPATVAATKAGATAKPIPAPVDPASPAGRAAKAPKKELADDGMIFGPDHAKNLQKIAELKKATPNTIMYIGPGFNEKSPQPKLSAGWKALPHSAKLVGNPASPRAMLTTLPDVLFKDKPEVVLIAGDDSPGRKVTATEAEDWEDVAKLCERMGAVPIFVMQTVVSKDEGLENISTSVRKAADINAVAALSAQPTDVYLRRVSSMLTLLDQHVFLRGKLDETKAGTTPVKVQDE